MNRVGFSGFARHISAAGVVSVCLGWVGVWEAGRREKGKRSVRKKQMRQYLSISMLLPQTQERPRLERGRGGRRASFFLGEVLSPTKTGGEGGLFLGSYARRTSRSLCCPHQLGRHAAPWHVVAAIPSFNYSRARRTTCLCWPERFALNSINARLTKKVAYGVSCHPKNDPQHPQEPRPSCGDQ